MPAPFLYRAWVGASMLLLPFFARSEIRKLRRAGLPVQRAHEKLGHASLPRPDAAPLIWFHGASVGESLSVLALIGELGRALPKAEFLMTSGTATSADLIARRLPPRTRHQFAPLDAPGPLKRFLRHWRPDAAVFVESELWPQMLRRTSESGAKMALVNARLSAGSRRNWQRFPKTSKYLLEVFNLILTQNDEMAQAMVTLNAPADRVARGINLKSLSAPLPIDHDLLYEARAALGHRPVWVASSTHAGEEKTVLAAHQALRADHPDLHLILAPRHPERGDAIAQMISEAGLTMTRRSQGDAPGGAVFLADSMGELGCWYALSDLVFLGGSLHPIGGHNPFEVAQAGALVLSGPHVTNFAETYAEMTARGAAFFTGDAEALTAQLAQFLNAPEDRAKAKAAAADFAQSRSAALGTLADRLIRALELARDD